MTAEGEREGVMSGVVVSRNAFLRMLVRSGQVAAPNGRPPLRVMCLKYEIVSAQALREPEKFVGMTDRFAHAS